MSGVTAASFGVPSEQVWKSYLIIPKFGAVVSIAASSFLARDIIRKWYAKKPVPLSNSVIFGISIVNIVGTFFGWFMTSWMIPRGDAPFAAGNQATCNAQGFFVSMSYIYYVTAYTGLAALYWLAVANEGYTRKKWIKAIFLFTPAIISIASSTVPFFHDMYNVATVFCYLNAYPPGCSSDPDMACTRGDHAEAFRQAEFAYTFACNALIIIFMSLLVHSVYSQERTGDRYLAERQLPNRTYTKKTTWHGVRYVGAFTISYCVVYIFMIWQYATLRKGTFYQILFYIHVIVNPLFGLFNASVYFYAKHKAYREQHPRSSSVAQICYVLNVSAPSSWLMFSIDAGNRKCDQERVEMAASVSSERAA
ncbi:hypothetical protein ACHAWF_001706 [Thalassiosira exigua]